MSIQLANFFRLMGWNKSDVKINSGYRNKVANAKVNGAATSDHVHGYAVDLVYNGRRHYPEVVKMADFAGQGKLCGRQMIWETKTSGGSQGIIHLGFSPKADGTGNDLGVCIGIGAAESKIQVKNLTSGLLSLFKSILISIKDLEASLTSQEHSTLLILLS